MIELLAGMVGGVGLFTVGMWLLTENLKTMVNRRLRVAAGRWTSNRFSALLWGTLAGCVTQSMAACIFVIVSILRSGLITPKGALGLILGGSIGVSVLVVVVSFDVGVAALYVVGFAGAVVVSDRLARIRPLAASCLGGSMIVLGLVLLMESAAPLADQPWFRDTLEGMGNSLVLAFLVAVLLTSIVQSSSAVCVIGISMATVGIISVDQAIMIMFGSCIGSGLIIFLLSINLRGRSQQVAMYMVLYNVLICVVLAPLFLVELHFDVALMKALVLSFDLDLAQQLALVFMSLSILPLPLMLAGLGLSLSVLDKLWPVTQVDALARPKFIHDHPSVDVETSLLLVDLEQKRVMKNLSQYFEMVRQETRLEPLREASRSVLSDIDDFLADLHTYHPMHGVEGRNAMMNRQKLLSWLEEALGVLCQTLNEPAERRRLNEFRMSICESVDSVLLSMVDAMENGDRMSWEMVRRLTGDRGSMMRDVRVQFLEQDPPLQEVEMINVLLITNTVEETFFVLSRMEREFNGFAGVEEHVPRG